MVSSIWICDVGVFGCEGCLALEVVRLKYIMVEESFLIMMHTPNVKEYNAPFGQQIPVNHLI
jgi:hypothetical protein